MLARMVPNFVILQYILYNNNHLEMFVRSNIYQCFLSMMQTGSYSLALISHSLACSLKYSNDWQIAEHCVL